MKKFIVALALPIAIFALAFSFNIAEANTAESVMCPAEYVCTPISTPIVTGSISLSLSQKSSGISGLSGQTVDLATYKLQANNSDMTVSSVAFDFSNRLWLYADRLVLKDELNNVVGSADLSSSNFVEITPDTDYRISILPNNFIIKSGQVKYITASITFKNNLDALGVNFSVLQTVVRSVDVFGISDIQTVKNSTFLRSAPFLLPLTSPCLPGYLSNGYVCALITASSTQRLLTNFNAYTGIGSKQVTYVEWAATENVDAILSAECTGELWFQNSSGVNMKCSPNVGLQVFNGQKSGSLTLIPNLYNGNVTAMFSLSLVKAQGGGSYGPAYETKYASVNYNSNYTETQCYQFTVNLSIGSQGADVVALQTWLIANGYDIPLISGGMYAKGNYDQATANAVAKYQASIGVPNTGFFGPLTRGLLNATCNSSPASKSSLTSNSFPRVFSVVIDGGNYNVGSIINASWQGSSKAGYNVYLSGGGNNEGYKKYLTYVPAIGVNAKVAQVAYLTTSYDVSKPGYGWTLLVCDANVSTNSNNCVNSGPFTISSSAATTAVAPAVAPAAICPPGFTCKNPNFIVDATLESTTEDRAGIWNNFGKGIGNMNRNSDDWNWSLYINAYSQTNPQQKFVKRITIISNNRGEVWSTGYSRYLGDGTDLYGYNEHPYPLVVLDGDSGGSNRQHNTTYDQSMNIDVGAPYVLKLYGQKESSSFPGGKVIVELTNGMIGSAIIDSTAAQTTTSQPSFTCPAGYICSVPSAAPEITYTSPQSVVQGGRLLIFGKNFIPSVAGSINSSVVMFSRDGVNSVENITPLVNNDGTQIAVIAPTNISGNYHVFIDNVVQGVRSRSNVKSIVINPVTQSPSPTPYPTYSSTPYPTYSSTPYPTYSSTPYSTPAPTQAPLPTASLTVQGTHNFTFTAGQTANYAWNSTNADIFYSTYTSNNGPMCGSGGNWSANTANGITSSLMSNSAVGCTWRVTYTAKNSVTGYSASDTITVSVISATPSSTPMPVTFNGSSVSASLGSWFSSMFSQ